MAVRDLIKRYPKRQVNAVDGLVAAALLFTATGVKGFLRRAID
jgi:hypothetical protein